MSVTTKDLPLSGLLGERRDEFSIPGLRSSGSSELVRRAYNLKNVLLSNALGQRLTGWEGQIHNELYEQHREALPITGTLVPFEVFSRRDLSVSGGAGTGGAFVETLVPPTIADVGLAEWRNPRLGACGCFFSYKILEFHTPSRLLSLRF